VPAPLFNLVLLNPEIPNNTGNIGRTAMATGCRLHIVRPIGFDMSEKARRRAGLDYWHLVDCVEHESWGSFLDGEGFSDTPVVPAQAGTQIARPLDSRLRGNDGSSVKPPSFWLYTTKSSRPHWEAKFSRGDYLLFGRETKGAPQEVHEWVARAHGEDHCITLPMVPLPEARSLNLATAVCAAVYEGMRQVRATEKTSAD
jgi:tRNA (cytidine/uridine-2'-O-)-methyltransferase